MTRADRERLTVPVFHDSKVRHAAPLGSVDVEK
jgi:hypothetical protein